MVERSDGGAAAAREWDAAVYDRVSDPMARWGAAVLDRLALTGGETVLDCGCGSGRVTELLLNRLPHGHVVALDRSRRMLDEARRRLAWAGDRVTLLDADLLDLAPGTLGAHAPVDAVLSTATFHWVTDHDRLFRNLAAVLRPGGRLVAQCGGEGNLAGLLAAVRSVGVERVGTWLYASPGATRDRLTAAGFAGVETWTQLEPTPLERGEPLHTYLEAICLREHVGTLPPQARRPFVEAVAAAMPEPVIDYVRLNMVARRDA
jgi:trans-aconitate 2-methyltransferase